ncbi:MAG: T9SS type A sorting domain-containing protein [Flavobacteriales bacterium]|nr:MAG: T9SS type A sorting domain-containing protein [Flavobacteriales bacterium]
MYRSILSCAALASALLLQAQQQVRQVFVLSEGYYDYFGGGGQLIPVTLGSYDPAAGTYQTVATLNGPRFGSDVLVDAGSVYVAADDRVVRFDADSYAQTGEALVPGVRKLAVWNDLLLLTRGELGGLPHYFEARDKATLALLWTIAPADGLTMSAEDVLVVGDKAYLAVNNAFDWSSLAGKVGVVDLVAQSYAQEIDLGPEGLNPEKLFVRDGAVLTFNNTDFSRSSISRVEADAAALEYTVTVAENSGCAASALVEAAEMVYFLEYAQGELVRFDIGAGSVSDTLAGSPTVYGLIEDPVNGVLYATTTDFVSSGELHVLSLDGQVQSTVPAAIAAGSMALDLRLSTALPERAGAALAVYPNPAEHEVFLQLAAPSGALRVFDSTGRQVAVDQGPAGPVRRLEVAALKPGLYTVQAEGVGTVRFTKR